MPRLLRFRIQPAIVKFCLTPLPVGIIVLSFSPAGTVGTAVGIFAS